MNQLWPEPLNLQEVPSGKSVHTQLGPSGPPLIPAIIPPVPALCLALGTCCPSSLEVKPQASNQGGKLREEEGVYSGPARRLLEWLPRPGSITGRAPVDLISLAHCQAWGGILRTIVLGLIYLKIKPNS